jgi:transposase
LKKEWCIPPAHSGEFVAHLEDVLEVYTRPWDPKRPQVCMDEVSKQLVGETRTPIPAAPGEPERYDYEYVRHGVANLFMFFEPLAGRREVKVTERRTMVDWAEATRELVEVHYPEAEKIVLVMDNLNTHGIGSLYEAFAPEEAWRIAQKLEIHHTPKHGSWLNMAESELSILSRQCLNQRIPDPEQLRREVAAWQHERNQAETRTVWRFTTEDARIRLARLYPSFEA